MSTGPKEPPWQTHKPAIRADRASSTLKPTSSTALLEQGIQAARATSAQDGSRERRAHARASRRWRSTKLYRQRRRQDRSRRSSPQIDAKLTEQINLIMHHDDFQQLEGAWRGLHHLVNNTETDEMLKIRVMNISKKELGKTLKQLQGHGLGPEPALQEDVRRGIRPVRRRAVRLPGRRLLLRPQPAGCRAAGRAWPRSRPRRTRRSSPAAAPTLMQMDSWQELANPRDLTKIFTDARVRRRGGRCANRRTPATSAWPCRASWRALPYGAKTNPVEEFDFEEDTERRRPQQVRLGQRGLRDGGRTSTARSSCTAGARASAASSRAARSRACRCTRSRPTTAAST